MSRHSVLRASALAVPSASMFSSPFPYLLGYLVLDIQIDKEKILRSPTLNYSRTESGRKRQKGVNQVTTAVQNQQKTDYIALVCLGIIKLTSRWPFPDYLKKENSWAATEPQGSLFLVYA